MKEHSISSWFYSHKGERLGPVSFEDLRLKTHGNLLDPRLDLVWTEGMAEWKAAGEIKGLFERNAPPPQPREVIAPSIDPHRSPVQESLMAQLGQDADWPGMRRGTFLFAVLILPILISLASAMAAPLILAQFGKEIAIWVFLGISILPFVIAFYVHLERLANLGMTRWWYLGIFVPPVNFWICYRCVACPSGYAFHKKIDATGVLFALVYWLIVLGVAALVATAFGFIGTPELRQQIQGVLRTVTILKS
jgi:GYF domain 2